VPSWPRRRPPHHEPLPATRAPASADRSRPPAETPAASAGARGAGGELRFTFLWYRYPALRVLAILAAIAAVGLLALVVLFRPGDAAAPAQVRAGGGPVATSTEGLAALGRELYQPVYWAGAAQGKSLEVTLTTTRQVYVRYLPAGAPVGDPSTELLTVGTYRDLHAYSHLRSYARHVNTGMTRVGGGGLAVRVPGYPTSVFLAYPGQKVQVEVYAPQPGRALSLIRAGDVTPVR
jgi:hypothetical protein